MPGFFQLISLDFFYGRSRRKHSRQKKPKFASELDSRIRDEDDDSVSRENVLKRDKNNMGKGRGSRNGMEYLKRHIKRKSSLEVPNKRQKKDGVNESGTVL